MDFDLCTEFPVVPFHYLWRCVMKVSCFALTIAASFAATLSATAADLQGYVATSTNNAVVGRTNFTTGAQTPLGPSGQAIRAIAESSLTGALYASDEGRGNLFQINTTTGAATFLKAWRSDDLAVFGNVLYGFDRSNTTTHLTSYNLNTDTVTDIGPVTLYPTPTAFAIDAAGNGIGFDEGSQFFFSVNLSNASTTNLGLSSRIFDAMDYGSDGKLYGWSGSSSSGGNLYLINPVIGTSTFARSFTFGGGSMAMDRPVPEPASIFILLGAASILAAASRRRRAPGALRP